jgi:RNA polymerase sigma-70 factor (family 1)
MPDFDAIFRTYYQQLFRYALKFVDSEDDAHNILQDIFTKVYEKKSYHKPAEVLKSYLFNTVRNSCLNHIKHEKVVNRHRSEATYLLKETEIHFYESSEKSLIEKETFRKIHTAINELPEAQREVILLSRFDGLKNKEIAEKLQIPIRTVETRIFRALAALREKLTTQTYFLFMNHIRSRTFFFENSQNI